MPAIDLYPQLSIEAVIVLVAAAAAVLIVSLIPSLADPFELLVTMIHEMGHVIAARLTGGEVRHFELYPPQYGGVTRLNPQKPGNIMVILPAGYIGAPLFSAGLILLSGWPYAARYTLLILGFLLVLAVVNYGQRSSLLTILTGLGFGLGFVWVAWQAELIWVIFLLYFLALQMTLMSLVDLAILVRLISQDPPITGDDASKMAYFAGCAPGCWAISWSLISVLMVGAAFWFTWLRTLEQ